MKEATKIRHELANRLQHLPADQIKQAVIKWLDTEDAELDELSQNLSLEQENSPQQTPLSTEERIAAFHDWVESHRGDNLPLLSDEAISRKSIYEDKF